MHSRIGMTVFDGTAFDTMVVPFMSSDLLIVIFTKFILSLLFVHSSKSLNDLYIHGRNHVVCKSDRRILKNIEQI